jgi:hypothetical protein
LLLLLNGCKGLEGGASTGGCMVGEAAAANTTTGTLAGPKGMARVEVSAPVGTNFALCVW